MSDCEVDDVAAIAAGSTGLRTIGAACWRVAGTSAGAEALTGAGRFGRLPVATGAAAWQRRSWPSWSLRAPALTQSSWSRRSSHPPVLAALDLAALDLGVLDLDACVLAGSVLVSFVLAALALVSLALASLCPAAVGFAAAALEAVGLGVAFGVADLGAAVFDERVVGSRRRCWSIEAAHASAVECGKSDDERQSSSPVPSIAMCLRGRNDSRKSSVAPRSSGRSGHGFLFD